MATDKKISQLNAGTPVGADYAVIVQTAGGANKKVLLSDVLALSGALLVESGAASKISALSADSAPSTDDLVATVNDPSGTPVSRRVTLGALLGLQTQVLIQEQLLSGAAASVTFSSIPSTYRHLRLLASGRGDTAATFIIGNLQFNSDAGANYDEEELFANGTTPGAAQSFGGTQIGLIQWPAASAPAGTAGSSVVEIANYAGTTFHKGLLCWSQSKRANSAGNYIYTTKGATWRSTSAIAAFTISASAGNFAAGCLFSLYGIR